MSPKPTKAALVGVLAFVAIGASLLWWLRVNALEEAIARKRSALKGLYVVGRLPPNREVMEYLATRTGALAAQYQATLRLVGPSPMPGEEQADPQLRFQQRVHEVQRTLERLAAARGMAIPALLGLPKELPPPEAVPRFLVQLELIEQAAKLLYPVEALAKLESFKVEDPQPVNSLEDAPPSFLNTLPVRIRLAGSLQAMAKIVGVLQHPTPLMELQRLQVVALPNAKELEMECVVARYLMTAPLPVWPDERLQQAPGRRTVEEAF